MIHNLKSENGLARPATRAEQAQAAYAAAALPSRPTAASLRPDWRARLLAGACGLALGISGTVAVIDQWAPLAGAARVRNAEIVIQNDDSRWFLIGGWAVRLPDPKAPASGQPGQANP